MVNYPAPKGAWASCSMEFLPRITILRCSKYQQANPAVPAVVYNIRPLRVQHS
nr:MAG TPA: hypothetical protein [Caudoviricetes sp.]